MKKKYKFALFVLVTILLLVLFEWNEAVYESRLFKIREDERASQLLSQYEIKLPKEFEYALGLDIDSISFARMSEEARAFVEISTNNKYIDTEEVGRHSVFYDLKMIDEYGIPHTFTIGRSYDVVDTQSPVIKFRKTTLTQSLNSSFDINKYVANVFDYVDGELEIGSADEAGKWWVVGGVDTKKKGTYTFHVEAKDLNGNITKSEALTLKIVEYSSFVDFDSRWSVVDGDQPEVNAGYIVRWGGDYWHHNWSSFMAQFNAMRVGGVIKLDGRYWKVYAIKKLPADAQNVYDTNGGICMNGTVELITCANGDGSLRWVAFLAPTNSY